MNKKIKIIIGIFVAVIIGMVVGLFIYSNSDSRELKKQLDLGHKYLLEFDYEQAIATFEKAIEIDPLCEEAYLGLADAYIAKGDYDDAKDVLQKGYELIGSDALKDKLDWLEQEIRNAEQQNQEEVVETEVEEEPTDEEIVLPAIFEERLQAIIDAPQIKGRCWREYDSVDSMAAALSLSADGRPEGVVGYWGNGVNIQADDSRLYLDTDSPIYGLGPYVDYEMTDYISAQYTSAYNATEYGGIYSFVEANGLHSVPDFFDFLGFEEKDYYHSEYGEANAYNMYQEFDTSTFGKIGVYLSAKSVSISFSDSYELQYLRVDQNEVNEDLEAYQLTIMFQH